MTSPNRRKEIVEPRQVAMYLLREISDLSYPYIGEKLGRDHTTAIHAFEKIAAALKNDEKLLEEITLLREQLYTII